MGTMISLPSLLKKKTLSYQSVFLIDEEGADLIDGGDYLCVTYRGNYEQSAYWGQQLAQYAHCLLYTSLEISSMESFMLLWESICCFSTFHTLVILDILCFLLHWEVWMNWHITVFFQRSYQVEWNKKDMPFLPCYIPYCV